MLHYQIQFPLCLNYLVELDDIWVPYLLEDLNLTRNSVDIRLVLNFTFFKNFNGYFLTCDCVNSKFDFAKGSFSERLLNLKVRNLFELTLFPL